MNSIPLFGTRESFLEEVRLQVGQFESVEFLRRVAEKRVTRSGYHRLLLTLFHQTRSGPYTFAVAAANCSWRHEAAKDYLLLHAEEERSHWRWILDDLKSTGYSGPHPGEVFPHPTTEAYISFNERVASRAPIARLAIASVLEGIGAQFGSRYGRLLLQTLGLGPQHATFFLSHGETDVVHAEELAKVIASCDLTDEEWGWMAQAAKVGGTLYRSMYGHEDLW